MMEFRGGHGLPTNPNSSDRRQLSERLLKERSKALEILHTQTDNKPKVNASQGKPSNTMPNKGSSKSSTSRSSGVGGSKDKKSPINKENISQNHKLPQPKKMMVNQLLLSNRSPNRLDVESRSSSKLNATDYVLYRHREAIDISELVLDDSITLDSSPRHTQKSSGKGTEISFNSAEITGRSTLDHCNSRESTRPSSQMSVHDILASSFSQKVRDLRKSLAVVGEDKDGEGFNRESMASSCISGFSEMQKNPRLTQSTENKSDSNADHLEECPNSSNGLGFSFGDAANITMASDDFVPAELMGSRLLEGEISWAQKFANIPHRVLSQEAKDKLPVKLSVQDPLSSFNMSTTSYNENHSFGNFFQMRANNIESMIQAESPAKRRHPICLVSDNTVSTTMTNSPDQTVADIEPITPAIDNKTYNKPTENGSTIKSKAQKRVDTHDSKDSGNATGKSDLWTLSEIDRALENINQLQNDNIRRNLSEILSKKKHTTSNDLRANSIMMNNSKASYLGTDQSIDIVKRVEQLSNIAEIILENKENIDISGDGCNGGQLDDTKANTLSFTESLLNTSIQNYRMSNAGQARSPLSPIPIIVTEPLPDFSDHDADTEYFGNSPQLSNRQKRLTKSPRSSPSKLMSCALEDVKGDTISQKSPTMDNQAKADHVSVAQAVTPTTTAAAMRNKSHSSTRLESERNTPNDNCAGCSPNFNNKYNKTLTPTQFGESNASNSFDLSPLSSPRSCFSSSANSPMGSSRSGNTNRINYKNYQSSPHFDSTTHSEQRYLNALGNGGTAGLRRVALSPSGNETSAPISSKQNNFGVPPMRTYSSNSVRSIESTSTRTASRCSYNSEFSHRDGKTLPLKATTLDLSWGSVKLRSNSQKSLQIKNTFNKRLVVRIQVHGPGFQLISPDSNMLTLQSLECRTILINFYPTVTGAAVGKLVFQSPKTQFNGSAPSIASNSNFNNDIIIPLYAYGGNASINIQNILKGPVGAPFLPMGELFALVQPLERTFQIYNKGPLTGFAVVCIEPIGLHVPGLSTAFEVFPQCTVIQPQSAATIRLVFQPTREDIKKIKKLMHDVLTLAKMRIIYGDEAMRQRLRQIHAGLPEEPRERLFMKSLDKLWTRFPGERTVPLIETFKESAALAQDMWSNLSEQEIALTLNNNILDETVTELSTIFTETDNSILFQTMCVSSPVNQLETVTELLEDSHVVATARHAVIGQISEENNVSSTSTREETTETRNWSISPDSVEFNFNRHQDEEPETTFLTVNNHFNVSQFFKVECNYQDLLCFMPTNGYVKANGGKSRIRIFVYPNAQVQKLPENITIMVQMDNEKILVPVHVSSRPRSNSTK